MSESRRHFIKEVILENFMSYEYARIPIGPTVNVICGPNGAGKSTILIGISVALGQTYTERSRKLSELIRRGKEIGRATVVIDNTSRGTRRPIPSIPKDSIILSRFMRRDGEYWFELDGRAAEKTEVVRLLGRLGVNPDNLLIIMHQNMVEEFTVLPPSEKLRIVEEASGLFSYRRDVLDSKRKLSRILSEEESLSRLLESSEQTLGYWKNQYQQLQTKRQLLLKRDFLERSLAWREVMDAEIRLEEVRGASAMSRAAIEQLEGDITRLESKLDAARAELRELDSRATASELGLATELIKRIERELKAGSPLLTAPTTSHHSAASEYRNGRFDPAVLEHIFDTLNSAARGRDARGGEDASQSQSGGEFLRAAEDYAEIRVTEALKSSQLTAERERLTGLLRDISHQGGEIAGLTAAAKARGARIDVKRPLKQLFEELKLTEGHLAALGDVSEDVERLYESYVKLHDEVLAKAQIVSENRAKLMEEIDVRLEKWRSVMRDLIAKTSLRYGEILAQVAATGSVELVGLEDVEAAGLELRVGFRGAAPISLNAFTQSGGERSTATVAFLLALQEFVKSPFRGIDEFDIHMDPRNRETIMKILYATVKDSQTQYIAITPSPLTVLADEAQILTVQSTGGRSEVKKVSV